MITNVGKILAAALLLWACTSSIAMASVRINEIAWMGTPASNTNEWIELYNDAPQAVYLSGWHIDAQDGAPSIALSGSIGGNGYYLIERTDDKTLPGVTADLVTSFGGGLSNAGETLYLKDASGVTLDTVTGGKDWTNIGGDNKSKETAQRTANSWITGTPTPRSENVSNGEILGASTISTADDGSLIVVSTDKSVNAFVEMPCVFTASVTDKNGNVLRDVSYRYNFGDGAIGDGMSATHTYHFVGDYAASLDVFWNGTSKNVRIAVSVTDPNVVIDKIATGTAGYIELKNRGSHELDMTGWHLRDQYDAGANDFIFPLHSIILPLGALRLPNQTTGLLLSAYSPLNKITLSYPDGNVIFVYSPPKTASNPATHSSQVVKLSPKPYTPSIATTSGVVLGATTAKMEETAKGAAVGTVLWQRQGVSPQFLTLPGSMQWLFVVLGILSIILAAYIIARSRIDEATAADEYAIIEDIIEGKDDLKGNSRLLDLE